MNKFKALKEGNCWDYTLEKDPRCPHCGKTIDIGDNEMFELYEDDCHPDVVCPYCDGEFHVVTSCEYRFCTEDQEED